jgi:DNA-directed RNA polymerase specialized sigma24 family protein
MNADTTITTAKTKLDARAEQATETKVTIDWSKASIEDVRALATRTIVIAAQAQWRKDGAIPAEVTLDAHEFANPTRAKRTKDPLAAAKEALAKMSPEERAAFLASLAG